MRKTIKEMILTTATLTGKAAIFAAVFAASAVLPSLGDDSAFARGTSAAGRLDLRTGTRIATEGAAIPITYSPRWGNAVSCEVTESGRAALVAAATSEGATSWTPQGTGGHTLTHTAGSTTYTAQFAVLGGEEVVHPGSSGESGTSGIWAADKTHLVTAPLAIPSGVSLTIEAGAVVKFMPGTSLSVASGGSCTAKGVIFTHIGDDTIGGDTLMDGDSATPKMGDYAITGSVTDDDSTEYRYMPPQTLTSSISSNTRLRGYRTYIVSNSVTVASGATLTLQPGTILKFNTGCSLTVNGTLDAQGTRAAPIVFTSLKDDAHGGDTNGDGDKTYAQADDWVCIQNNGGRMELSHVTALYGGYGQYSNQGDAIIRNRSGTTTLKCCEIKHSNLRLVGRSGGSVYAENCVLEDGRWGIDGSVTFINGVIMNCNIGSSGGTIKNTIYYNCGTYSSGSTVANSIAFGNAQSVQYGMRYADPLFVDPDNGDFRIAANSPCVDAGDGSVAPATDYWGQPRMDVKRVKDKGVPNGDGVCPDIGIYEMPGTANVPLPDLAVVGRVVLNAPDGGLGTGRPTSVGDTLTVTYTVTNRGAAAVSGLVRDLFRFKGADAATSGLTVDAAEIEQAYSVPTGGCATLSATITVPTLKAGKWKVGVMVNSGRVPYEAVIANNSAEADEVITVAVEPFAVGESKDVEIPAGGMAGAAVAGLPAGGGAIVAALPNGIVFYAAAGYVPDETRHDAAGVQLADGRTALFIPVHEEGETVYVTLVNDSGTAQTVTLAALASGDGLEVAKPADVAVTAKGPKVAAKLVLPESVRDGRVYAAWVEYSNSGDEDAELPIFTVSRTGGGATLSATAKGAYSANPLSLVGLAPSAPRGKLKPGEAGRVAFYFMSSGNLSLKLGMVTEKSTSVLNGFATVAEYRAGMSAAATRLCARGGAEPGFTEVLAQALNEKRGAGGAAVCGTLRHSATKMPMAGVEVHLVLTNDSSVVNAVLTDANGHFTLTADDAGDYAVDVRDVFSLTPCIVSLAVGEDTPVSLSAVPLSSVSGVVEYSGTAEIAVGATVVLDDLSTAEAEDRVAETDESGMYSFGGLADGEYRLSLYPFEGYALVESDAFSVSNGVPVSRNLSYGAKGRVLFGVVADVETGAVVSNAVVMLSRGGTSLGVTTDGDGRFKFDGIAAGRWGLTLEASAHQVDGLSEIVVEDGAGEQRIDIPARAKCPFAVLRPVGMVPHKATFSILREGVTSLEWDFDGDGVADSTSETPEWTYSAAGTYSVALSYTDGDGVRRRSQWTDAVKVVAPFENVLKPNGALVSEADGVAVESVSETELVLSGSPVSAWASPGTVLGAETSSKGGFIRRVVSSENLGGGRWRFTVEKAGLADLYEQYFMSGDIALSAAKARKLMAARLASASRSGSGEEVSHGAKVVVPEREADNLFTLPTLSYAPPFSDASASITGSFEAWNGDAVKGSYGALVFEGRVLMTWYSATDTYKATVTASASYTKDWTKGLTGKEPFSKTWNQSWADIPIGWGFSLSLQTDEDLKFSIEGSGTVTVEQSFMARRTQMFFFDEDGELDSSTTTDWGATTSTKRSITGSISPTLDASLTLGLYGSFAKFVGRAGGGPKVGAKLSVTQSLGVGVENSFSAGSSGVDFDMAPIVESKLELGFTPYVGVNVSWKWLNIPKAKKYDVDLPLKMEWPNTASVGKMGISTAGDGLTVTFTAQNPKIEATGWIFKDLLGLDGVEVPADKFLWGLGDGSLLQEGRTVTHTYAKEGRYKIRLFGGSPIPATLITYTGSPFVRTSVKWIEVFDDKPPEPQDTADTGSKSPKQSCDPNEMDGPDGVGEERYVKPGEWMTYTVYFENKSDADVPAQEVRVTNPLSEWLDWSTFEMCDIAFCNQVETGLVGKQNGTITVGQNDTAYKVQATVALNGDNGVVEWYLRSLDPARADFNYWPPDGEGLLPPNDATHCGEGHLTYRVKVRENAPANVVITNSASIVFDYNDPIETDPAWWNTVGSLGAAFSDGEVVVSEGETATIKVMGGSADAASSVKVYLTYNTAAAADVDLKKMKFPLTLTWEKGEVGEKTITIPVKVDKAVEGDEFFTLQLGDAQGMELGEGKVCTVAIHDPGYDELAAKVAAGTATAAEVKAWNKLQSAKAPYMRGLAEPANAGKVTCGALCAEGRKATLKATANKGWVFVGWQRGGGNAGCVTLPDEYLATTPVLVIDRSARPAKGSATSTTLTDVAEDATFYACFVTSEEDKASIAASVDGWTLEPWASKTETNAFATNIWAGVYLEWPVASSALSATSVKVSGLPAGLKFASKPVTKKIGSGKTAVTVTNILANTIYGAPTAASKIDAKTGAAKPSMVKLTVTTAGKSTRTYQIDTVVDALPVWAVGTFAGGVYDGDGRAGSPLPAASGTVSLAIAANGKISGKLLEDGLTWTLSAPWFDEARLDGSPSLVPDSGSPTSEVGSPVFIATVIGKSGKQETTNVVTVAEGAVGGIAMGGPRSVAADSDDGGQGLAALPKLTAWQYNWKVEPWKTLGKSFDKNTVTYAILADGTFSEKEDDVAAALGAEVTGRVTLKFAANGTVKVAGEFVAGYDEKKARYTTVKATGSATLVPVDENGGAVFIYLAPKGLAPHARSLGLPVCAPRA